MFYLCFTKQLTPNMARSSEPKNPIAQALYDAGHSIPDEALPYLIRSRRRHGTFGLEAITRLLHEQGYTITLKAPARRGRKPKTNEE